MLSFVCSNTPRSVSRSFPRPRLAASRVLVRDASALRGGAPRTAGAQRRSMQAPAAKRLCGGNMAAKIGTHNGTFHCDEVLACFFLRQLPEYKDAEIIRTRDPAELAKCDVVVDVGGEFDPQIHRYDHHQRSFKATFNTLCPEKPWATKLSSAGLVYLHFGRRLLAHLTQLKEGDRQLEALYDKLYENFVEEVDAVDNGVSQCDGEARYTVSTTLSTRVGHLNPWWNSKSQDTEEGFRKAMTLVGSEFLDRLDYYQRAWLPARAVVEEAIGTRMQVDPSGEVVMFARGGCPWKEHLLSLEKELGVQTPIKFVLYPDQSGQWRVQCVPAGLNTFQNRLSLLEEWQGIRDNALSDLSGIPGCIFVHASGFIGGNKTREGALEMARRTLQAAAKARAVPASPTGCRVCVGGYGEAMSAGRRSGCCWSFALLCVCLWAARGDQCPEGCHCVWESRTVLCADAGLREIPQDLPTDTVSLHLERNFIRSIPENAFSELLHLQDLYLSHNRIETLSSGALRHLSPDLRMLDLSHNLLRQASQEEFGITRAKTRLYHNPWHCDCALQELMQTLILEPETVNAIVCESSARGAGEGGRWEDPKNSLDHSGQSLVKLLDAGVNFCSLQRKTTDVAMLVTMFVWFFMVIVYVVYYVRQNQAEARRHLEYLKSLPSPRKTTQTESDTLSTGF
ncbi:MYG1 exonuclease [Denticeps clupeoides]|uniref:LRRNT domain-containing protein n=1 Tax=Denticeps clupeoides TaxID=299321 RepID=A0AAY4EUM8_9TELE|nr:UPF0160 protein MYG1, mitochondrial [Denticeps clupeoides]